MSSSERVLVTHNECLVNVSNENGCDYLATGFQPRKLDEFWLPTWLSARDSCERNESLKQLIPYIYIVCLSGTEPVYLTYQRSGSEKRLDGQYSMGIGGHVNTNNLIACAQREIVEEVNLTAADTLELFAGGGITHMGTVFEDQTPVGRVHFGLVFRFEASSLDLTSREGLEFKWRTVPELMTNINTFELWSQFLIKALVDGTLK